MRHQLILGGTRSGKSLLAEQLAEGSELEVHYVATAEAGDGSMAARIAKHREQRPASWPLIEEPFELSSVIAEMANPNRLLLIDCLSLWLTNWLLKDDRAAWQAQKAAFLFALEQASGPVILVSNETNMGVVPMGELSREFCDQTGLLHQQVAKRCDRVVLAIAGLPQVLKGPALPIE